MENRRAIGIVWFDIILRIISSTSCNLGDLLDDRVRGSVAQSLKWTRLFNRFIVRVVFYLPRIYNVFYYLFIH